MDQKKSALTTNKDKMRILIENNVVEKIKSIFRENEMLLEKQLSEKQEAEKDDANAKYVKGKIHEISESNEFGKFATSLRQCGNLNQNLRAQYSKTFEDLQKLFNNLDRSFKDQPILRIKINNYIGEFTKQTIQLFGQLHDDYVRLNQAGFCGVSAALKSFQDKYHEFEFKVLIWKSLPQFENHNVEYQILKQGFEEKGFRTFLQTLINQTYPDQVGDTLTVEKEVIKYIEVPKVQIVEKTNTIEKPIVVEKIVEKVIVQEVERRVPEIHEVIKEVIKTVSIPDRIREAHEMLFGMGKPQNVTEALNIYYEEAEVNQNVLAFNSIGQIFLEGKFFPKDLNKSYQYYEKSAQQNDPEGLYRVGYFLFNNIIDGFQLSQGRLDTRDKELEEAVMYFQKASEQGHLEALTDLGEIFEHGIQQSQNKEIFLIEPELEQAEFYYTQGKKVRFPRATCLLGLFYLNHPEYKQKIKGDNARKAIKYFELARDLGHPAAYYHLAFCYENGMGVNYPNRETAKSYYKDGALRGDTKCKTQYMYYVMYDASNSGKAEDYKFAYNYFREILTTDPQITETYYYLGHLYECGFGVVKDPQISMSFFNKGALLGNAACMNKLGDFYHSGFGVPRNHREALAWYLRAAELQDGQALINLGTIFEEGYDGVAPDRAKAFNCYEEASKQNNSLAFFHMGLMYESGRYVNKDLRTAVEMYKKAASMGCQQARDLLIAKKIPMIYDDGINTAHVAITMEGDQETVVSAFDKWGLVGYKEDKPLISNVIVTQMGKKNNQNILQSKLDRQSDGRPQSILLQTQSQYHGNEY